MRKFALFFMLALTTSMIAVLSEPVFAEEMTGSTADEAATEGSADKAMSEEMTATSSASVEGTTMEPHTDSPLKQLSMGVDPHQIQCSAGHKLVFKASNWNPACVKESSFQTLSTWGWVANHDPSHDDLAKMMEDHMAKYPKETENPPVEENTNAPVDSSSTNGTEQPKAQSHTINLSESMDMGAQ